MTKTKLTAEQLKANKEAIHGFIIQQTKVNGGLKNSPVILIPEFQEDTDGKWLPISSNGVRKTVKEGLGFTRLGMAFLRDDLTAGFMYTNQLADEAQLIEGLALMDIGIGDMIPGKVLVAQESLSPFSKTNPDNDLKRFPISDIPCTIDDQPIYRRIVLKPIGTPSVLIAHNNGDAQSKHMASMRLQSTNKPTIANDATKSASRIAQLKAVPKGQRTAAQKAELEELIG